MAQFQQYKGKFKTNLKCTELMTNLNIQAMYVKQNVNTQQEERIYKLNIKKQNI